MRGGVVRRAEQQKRALNPSVEFDSFYRKSLAEQIFGINRHSNACSRVGGVRKSEWTVVGGGGLIERRRQ